MDAIRALFKSDLETILPIEESVHVAPWTRETFLICFQAGYAGWLVEINKQVMGFIIVSLRAEECHILNLCISRDYQHQGYGRQLLSHALRHARKQGIGIAYLEVRRSNAPAIALYKKEQFQLIGERKDYYPIPSGHEDALIFAKSLHIEPPF